MLFQIRPMHMSLCRIMHFQLVWSWLNIKLQSKGRPGMYNVPVKYWMTDSKASVRACHSRCLPFGVCNRAANTWSFSLRLIVAMSLYSAASHYSKLTARFCNRHLMREILGCTNGQSLCVDNQMCLVEVHLRWLLP